MANATATLSVYAYPKGVDNTQRNLVVRGTITLSQGVYPPNAAGFALNWAALEEVKSAPAVFPTDVDVKSVRNPPSGVVYAWDSTTGNLHIYVSNNGVSSNSGPLIEFNGTLPQWIFADTIQFTAVFARNN